MKRPDLVVAQRLLLEHGILPGDYLKRPPGERVLIRALLIDHRRRKEGEICGQKHRRQYCVFGNG